MDERQLQALKAYSRGQTTALKLRRRLGGVTYGEALMLPDEAELPLPRAPAAGREGQIRGAARVVVPKV